jgi:hypothetical protein
MNMSKKLAFVAAFSFASSAWAEPPKDPKCTVLPQPDTDCAVSPGRAATIRLARVGVELVLGTLFGAGLGSLGAYAGLNVDLAQGKESGAGFAIGTSFGVALGVAPGVWLGGRAMGGDGSIGWTLLGSALGTGISAALLAVDSSPGMLFLGATIPLSTSILAFELSSHLRKESAKKTAPSAKILPSVGPRYVGVTGVF